MRGFSDLVEICLHIKDTTFRSINLNQNQMLLQESNYSVFAQPASETEISSPSTAKRAKKTLRLNSSQAVLGKRYTIAKKVNKTLKLTLKKKSVEQKKQRIVLLRNKSEIRMTQQSPSASFSGSGTGSPPSTLDRSDSCFS